MPPGVAALLRPQPKLAPPAEQPAYRIRKSLQSAGFCQFSCFLHIIGKTNVCFPCHVYDSLPVGCIVHELV